MPVDIPVLGQFLTAEAKGGQIPIIRPNVATAMGGISPTANLARWGDMVLCGGVPWQLAAGDQQGPFHPDGGLIALRFQCDELAKDVVDLSSHRASDDSAITPEKVERLAALLRDKLDGGSAEFRRAYAWLVLREVSVKTVRSGSAARRLFWQEPLQMAFRPPHKQFSPLFENGAPHRVMMRTTSTQ